MTIRHRLDAGWPIERVLRDAPSQQSTTVGEQIRSLSERLNTIESKLNEILDKLDS